MPLNKRGEFIPKESQFDKGAMSIKFSQPYLRPYTSDVYQVDVWMIKGSGSSFTQVAEIKGVTENVAREIARRYSQDIRTSRSKRSMSERTEYFKADFFSREFGRTGVLMENLANDAGLAQVFKAGLQGHLSPQAQADFDSLTFMAGKISENDVLTEDFYRDAKDQLNIIASKYERWKANNKALGGSDFTDADVKEVERALKKLRKLATKYYLKSIGYDENAKGIGTKSQLNQMRIDEAFIEGTTKANKGGRKLKTRNTKW